MTGVALSDRWFLSKYSLFLQESLARGFRQTLPNALIVGATLMSNVAQADVTCPNPWRPNITNSVQGMEITGHAEGSSVCIDRPATNVPNLTIGESYICRSWGWDKLVLPNPKCWDRTGLNTSPRPPASGRNGTGAPASVSPVPHVPIPQSPPPLIPHPGEDNPYFIQDPEVAARVKMLLQTPPQ